MSRVLRVYVAGPLSGPDLLGNVRRALQVGAEVRAAGHAPFVPHLSVLWELQDPRPYEDWMRWCLAWVEACDALLRMEGASPGADREVAHARERGVPVVGRVAELAGVASGLDQMGRPVAAGRELEALVEAWRAAPGEGTAADVWTLLERAGVPDWRWRRCGCCGDRRLVRGASRELGLCESCAAAGCRVGGPCGAVID